MSVLYNFQRPLFFIAFKIKYSNSSFEIYEKQYLGDIEIHKAKATLKILLIFCINITLGNVIFCQNEYYPLEKGKTYTYSYTSTFSDDDGQRAKVEILDDLVEINGKRYYVYKSLYGKGEDYHPLQTIYLRNGENGSIVAKSQLEDVEEAILFPEKPWNSDKSWTTTTMGSTTVSTIISLDAKVETPIKTYKDCMLVEFDLGESKTRSYYQKGKGMVAVTMLFEGQEKLLQYIVNE